jgi:circadian clock protein KaiB
MRKAKAKSKAKAKAPVRKKAARLPAVPPPRYQFQLFVTGTTLRSTQAVANIRALCEQHLPGRYELEVIDLYQQPDQAALSEIIAAPTLVKKFPGPLIRMVGNLANREQLLVKLNLAGDASNALPA